MAGADGGAAMGERVDDKRVEIFLGKLLRWGVLLAAVVVFVGGVWFLVKFYGVPQSYKTFRGQPAELRSVPQIVHQAMELRPLGLIQFGLLLLIATPVARVLFSVLGFALERDWMYVVITLLVLALLIYTLTSRSEI
ncbi:MAG: DUF1634 domain-containing protein [Candidatus Acidiferrales bacterium]|jgi:uncharacterized membrane protein